jgi:hypothetical protein
MALREDLIDRHLFRKSNGWQYHIRLFKIRSYSFLTSGIANFIGSKPYFSVEKRQISHVYKCFKWFLPLATDLKRTERCNLWYNRGFLGFIKDHCLGGGPAGKRM